ncbi:MAG TPA: hypothetical protein VJ226_09325 [Bradyrhizobium sp.]|nr:hypothetical protein [Bradyrhizobium sp.]
MALYTRTLAHGTSAEVIVRNADGAFIPEVAGNIDYIFYLAWLALGNTPDVGVIPSNPTVIPLSDFWARFTSAEQTNIQNTAVLNGSIPTQLAFWGASNMVDLTAASTVTWMNTLVSSLAITSARRTTILTP